MPTEIGYLVSETPEHLKVSEVELWLLEADLDHFTYFCPGITPNKVSQARKEKRRP
jgi:hypothetical protein